MWQLSGLGLEIWIAKLPSECSFFNYHPPSSPPPPSTGCQSSPLSLSSTHAGLLPLLLFKPQITNFNYVFVVAFTGWGTYSLPYLTDEHNQVSKSFICIRGIKLKNLKVGFIVSELLKKLETKLKVRHLYLLHIISISIQGGKLHCRSLFLH